MLNRARHPALVALLAIGMSAVGIDAAAQGGDVDCGIDGICRIEAESPGASGSASSSSSGGGNGASSSGGPPPPTGCRTFETRDPTDGQRRATVCDGPGGMRYIAGYSEPGDPAPVLVDPAELAQQAIEQMALGPPKIRMSAPPDRGFVGVPVWLWVERDPTSTGPVSESASAGQVTVTATARVQRTEWTMGPPGEAVICRGPGTPWTGQSGPSPTCGYTYQLRSLPERTGGEGRWPITATNVWTVEWSGGGASGSETLRMSSDASLAVGEIQVVTDGGGGQ